jgi:hypothetical protein
VDSFDEAFDESGAPRPLYGWLIEDLEARDLGDLEQEVREQVAARGIDFGDGTPIDVYGDRAATRTPRARPRRAGGRANVR